MRKWRPPDVPADEDWRVIHQIVVPVKYRNDIMVLAHEFPTGGHMGVNKTHKRILQYFYWPQIRKDVSKYCRTCHTCQLVGKPNQGIKKAPLYPIPAFDQPFARLIIDCVGPLPRTRSGNNYLLTMMCSSTRFPEAVPLRKINSQSIVKALVKFFTVFGIPKEIQSDRGSVFLSGIFQQVMHLLQVKQIVSSAYHPESQGALERYHQTMKSMLRAYCFEHDSDWDESIPFVLFASRSAVQESLGFSPFDLVFGHHVRGPLTAVSESILNEESNDSLLDYVVKFRERLQAAWRSAHDNLRESQTKMKSRYDKHSANRTFEPGDKVLVLFPVTGKPLQAKYMGPYVIDKKVGPLDYLVHTPDRRKGKQMCHVNMLKAYHSRDDSSPVVIVNSSKSVEHCKEIDLLELDPVVTDCDDFYGGVTKAHALSKNSDVLSDLHSRLSHVFVQLFAMMLM
jgi:hypothetical protein